MPDFVYICQYIQVKIVKYFNDFMLFPLKTLFCPQKNKEQAFPCRGVFLRLTSESNRAIIKKIFAYFEGGLYGKSYV
jgi:hypothetical protein